MIGREPDALFPDLAPPSEEPLIEARDIRSGDGIVEVERFVARKGEVVGIAGLDGSGRDTLARILGGVEKPAGGTIELDGGDLRRPNPSKAVRAGITFVPPDRRRQAIIDEFSIARTMTQSAIWKFVRVGMIRLRNELHRALQAGTQLGVKSPDFTNGILTLSGGNQQKAILARALVAESKLLVCDEPTAGVDVGARADIYGQFAVLAEQGLGIVLSSSDMVELMGMCHRIVVIREGRVSADIPASEATEERLLAAQLPVAELSALS
jgi:ABC-type sugar transport system ATPase subunit